MSTPIEHLDIPLEERHAPHNWEYADATAREAATGFVPEDIGRQALQLDDFSRWTLIDDDPATWRADASLILLGWIIDGGGAAITTGIKGDLGPIPFACTILEVTMLADHSGSIVVDIWKDTYANFPPTDADSITASAPPTISTAVKSQDSTLTGWTTSIAAGNILRFNVDSVTDIQRVSIALKVRRS
jgi:hypothetical protein